MPCDPSVDSEQLEAEALRSLVDFRGASVLEVGVGDARLTRQYILDAARIVGLDPDAAELAGVDLPHPWRTKVSLLQGDARSLPFPPESFDQVILAWSL